MILFDLGVKYDLAEGRRRDPTTLSDILKHWPWQRFTPDDYRRRDFQVALPENFQQLLERNRNQASNDEDFPYDFTPPRRNLKDIYEEYQHLEKARNHNFPYSSSLDDVRPYPHEDDFTFGEEENEESDEGEVDETSGVFLQHPEEGVVSKGGDKSSEISDDGDNAEEVARREALKGAKFVEDPTQFAYPPTDARFFRNAESGGDYIFISFVIDVFFKDMINYLIDFTSRANLTIFLSLKKTKSYLNKDCNCNFRIIATSGANT